jgi:hypothetical protein
MFVKYGCYIGQNKGSLIVEYIMYHEDENLTVWLKKYFQKKKRKQKQKSCKVISRNLQTV